MTFKKVDPKVSFPKMEEEILKFWDENKIFEKSVSNRDGAKRYSFNDGPPFATGLPHYGHIVGSIMKDVVPRFWTMKGFQVERKWGWDCHGLPIENIAEKALGIKHKKDIEEMGVAKFNEFCRSTVLEYAAEWEKVIPRIGRWADMKNAYRTMDKEYMESVWWVFKELWDKGLVYEGYRSMHICPRCETTLSQQEVSEGYKDVKDLSVIAKFELADEPGTYVLAWTTTPWTLPGNVALAIKDEIDYVLLEAKEDMSRLKKSERIIFAFHPEVLSRVLGEGYQEIHESNQNLLNRIPEGYKTKEGEEYRVVKLLNSKEIVGKYYKPLFSYLRDDIKAGRTPASLIEQGSNLTVEPDFARRDNEKLEEISKKISDGNKEREKFDDDGTAYKIYSAKFVTTEDGTGVVHIAPAFGEDDMALGKEKELPFVQHVKMDGTMKGDVRGFEGLDISPRAKGKVEEIREADLTIVNALKENGLYFTSKKYPHSYPHCWRCDTPLLNYATSSWFVSVMKIKEKMLELAESIRWSPEHIKVGRFGKWLEGARDWSISRQRYWASVMPIWKCECGEMKVFGSVAELEEASGKKVDDLHKHVVDEITVPCEKCSGTMKRVPDVLDTWFDSGSMPYAQEHYPFGNKEHFEKSFPADFIAEGVDQTRAWFYYQHVIGTAIKENAAFKNVIVNGIVLAEDGKKMSKKLQNYPDPMEIVNKYGADSLRFYLLSSPIVAAENLNFSERDLTETSRNVFRMLWNSYSFFVMYADIDQWQPTVDNKQSTNLLDRWILSELQILIRDVDASMEAYELNKATRALMPFIDNLSNWYIRRSRKRFWKSEDDTDKEQAYQTLYDVLVTLSKLMAPFTPFLAEEMYRNLTGEESVHLAEWPVADESLIDGRLNEEMKVVRELVTIGLKLRADAKVKVRQPLSALCANVKISKELQDILIEELNVKDVRFSNHPNDIVSTDEDKWIKHISAKFTDVVRVSEGSFSGIISFIKNLIAKNNVPGVDFIALNITITEDLKLEGEAREIIRAIQEGRKKAGFNVEDRVTLGYQGKEKIFEKFEGEIAKEILATEVKNELLENAEYSESVTIEGGSFEFQLKRTK